RREEGHDAKLRRLWSEGPRARAHQRARDRSCAPRHHAPDEARRPRLDSRIPGRAGVEEAGRSPHGFGQGRAGILDRQDQAGTHPVRGRRCRPRDGEGSHAARRREAFDRDQVHCADGCLTMAKKTAKPKKQKLTAKSSSKAEDWRAKSADELGSELTKLKKESFNLRFQRANGSLEKTHRARAVRRTIARIETVLTEQRRKAG